MVILFLAGALYQAKQVAARLRGEISRNSVPPFVYGGAAPEIDIMLPQEGLRTLRGLCEHGLGAETVIVVATSECEACRALDPLIDSIAEQEPPLHLVLLYADSLPRRQIPGGRGSTAGVVTGGALRASGIREVPSAILLDGSCRLKEGVVGAVGSRLLLERRIGMGINGRAADE